MNNRAILTAIAPLLLVFIFLMINRTKDNSISQEPVVNQEKKVEPQAEAPKEESTKEVVAETAMVKIKTPKGEIVLKLYPDVAPKTVANFLSKVTSGYYDGLIFHRVEDWVIQGGDPDGNGTGGGSIPTELSNTPFKEGSFGVARGGDIKISNDSQFFICTTDCSWLTGGYTIFGEVVSGMDVAKKVSVGDKMDIVKGE